MKDYIYNKREIKIGNYKMKKKLKELKKSCKVLKVK